MKKRSGFFLKLAFLSIVLFLFVVMIQVNIQINERETEYEEVLERLDAQQDEIARVQEELDAPYTEETIRRIAKEQLNLCNPGDIVYESDNPN